MGHEQRSTKTYDSYLDSCTNTSYHSYFAEEEMRRKTKAAVHAILTFLFKWSGTQASSYKRQHKEKMQNEAGSEPFAKEKIWRAGIEPQDASLWS